MRGFPRDDGMYMRWVSPYFCSESEQKHRSSAERIARQRFALQPVQRNAFIDTREGSLYLTAVSPSHPPHLSSSHSPRQGGVSRCRLPLSPRSHDLNQQTHRECDLRHSLCTIKITESVTWGCEMALPALPMKTTRFLYI